MSEFLQAANTGVMNSTLINLEALTDDEEKSIENWAKLGHVTFLTVAVSHAVSGAFRYSSAPTYNEVSGTPWITSLWSSSNMIANYADLIVGSLLTVTSILAILSINTNVNIALWSAAGLLYMGIGLIQMLVTFAAGTYAGTF